MLLLHLTLVAVVSRKTLITIGFTARSTSVHYVDIPLHHFSLGHLKYSTLPYFTWENCVEVKRKRGTCKFKVRQDLN